MNILEWIQKWFFSQCNGDWEHRLGITIETLDNPGWRVVINLEDTSLDGVSFTPVSIERSESNWLTCRVRDKQFEGFGGPENLVEIMDVFRIWSESTLPSSLHNPTHRGKR
jgi:hypothetical protein